MDAQMKEEDLSADYPVWDLKVKDGIVPILSGDREDIQVATLASFIELGTIPQLPDVGVSWTKFLTGEMTFGELDVEIRTSIQNAGKDAYRPEYEINGDRLSLQVTKEM